MRSFFGQIAPATFLMFLLPALAWAAPKPLPFFDADDLTPFWPEEATEGSGARTLHPARVTAFQVIDQDGVAVTEKTFETGPSVVNFFFADCPSLCPTMMRSIQRFQKSLGPARSAVKIYSFSVKPEKDTPDALRKYAAAYRINPREWRLLTGNRGQIYHVGKDMFKADGSVGDQKSASSFIHTKNAYLVDSSLRIRGIYDTDDAKAMKLLAEDISTLRAQH